MDPSSWYWSLISGWPWSRPWFIIIRPKSVILTPWIAMSNFNPDSWSSNWNLVLQLVLGLRSSLTNLYLYNDSWRRASLLQNINFGWEIRLACLNILTCGQMCFHLQNRGDIWISDMWAHALADKVSIWVHRLLPECDCSLVLCDLKQPLCIAQRNTKMPSSKIRTTCRFEMHFHIDWCVFAQYIPKDFTQVDHRFVEF